MTDDYLFLAERRAGDPVAADYRVLFGHDGAGTLRGYAVDLAVDANKTPGSEGFDLFDIGGAFLEHVADLPMHPDPLIAFIARRTGLRPATVTAVLNAEDQA